MPSNISTGGEHQQTTVVFPAMYTWTTRTCAETACPGADTSKERGRRTTCVRVGVGQMAGRRCSGARGPLFPGFGWDGDTTWRLWSGQVLTCSNRRLLVLVVSCVMHARTQSCVGTHTTMFWWVSLYKFPLVGLARVQSLG